MTEQIEFVAGNVKSAMKKAGASSSDLWKVPRDLSRSLGAAIDAAYLALIDELNEEGK